MQKHTKKALTLSVLSLVLCVSMLVGTTFAWFTDSVTTGVNTIQSGTLDVDLLDEAGNSLAGDILAFEDKDNNNLWEPGCTYNLQPVIVKNNGNLALKYEIAITGLDGNAKLLEAIEWTVFVDETATALADLKGELLPGEASKELVLSGHMKEEAGNEYQGLTVDGIAITVYATQLTHEFDSEDNQYDAAAKFAADTMLDTVAAGAAGESATVKLESDGYVVINENDAIGAVVKGDVTLDLNGKTLFVKVEDGNAHMSLFNIVKNGKLTVTGNGTINVVSGKNPLVTAIFNNTAGTLVIEDGTYKMDHMNNWQDALIPTLIDTNSSAGQAITTINGGNFYHTRNMFRNFPGVKSELIINGGTFNGKSDDWAAIWNQKPGSSEEGYVTINGGTFNYVEINDECGGKVTINNNVVIPVPVSTADELVDAIAAGENVVLTKDISVDVADTAFTVAKDVSAKIDLNGHDIISTSTSDESVQLFSVSGNLEIVGEGTISLTNDNFAWNTSYRYTPINIRETGVVTLGEGVKVVCETGSATSGGYGMNYAVDIYTTGTLNVNGASLHSNYIAVRCFFGNSVVNVNSGSSITSSRNNYGIWPQSSPGAIITIADGVSYTVNPSNGIYSFN